MIGHAWEWILLDFVVGRGRPNSMLPGVHPPSLHSCHQFFRNSCPNNSVLSLIGVYHYKDQRTHRKEPPFNDEKMTTPHKMPIFQQKIRGHPWNILSFTHNYGDNFLDVTSHWPTILKHNLCWYDSWFVFIYLHLYFYLKPWLIHLLHLRFRFWIFIWFFFFGFQIRHHERFLIWK